MPGGQGVVGSNPAAPILVSSSMMGESNPEAHMREYLHFVIPDAALDQKYFGAGCAAIRNLLS